MTVQNRDYYFLSLEHEKPVTFFPFTFLNGKFIFHLCLILECQQTSSTKGPPHKSQWTQDKGRVVDKNI